MQKIRLVLGLFLITGCNIVLGSSCDGCELYIWTETSQRIVIDQGGGLLPKEQHFDYVRDALPDSAVQILEGIRVKNSELICINDGFTFDIVITDENGTESEYLSNNQACNGTEGLNFVRTQDIEALVELLQ